MDEHFLFVILFIIIFNPRNTIPIAMKLYTKLLLFENKRVFTKIKLNHISIYSHRDLYNKGLLENFLKIKGKERFSIEHGHLNISNISV